MVLNSCNLCKSGRNNSWKNSSSIYSQAIFLTQKRSHCQLKMLLLSSLKRKETGNMAGKRHSNIIQRKEISIKHVFWSKKIFFSVFVFFCCCCLYESYSYTWSLITKVKMWSIKSTWYQRGEAFQYNSVWMRHQSFWCVSWNNKMLNTLVRERGGITQPLIIL